MKIKLPLPETVSAIILVTIVYLLRQNESLLMPKNLEMMFIIILIISFLVYAAAIWRESPADEREHLLRLKANRMAYLSGLSLAVIGLVQQTLEHNIDIWLVAIVISMVSGKLASIILSQWRN